jgi:hypothetical protein
VVADIVILVPDGTTAAQLKELKTVISTKAQELVAVTVLQTAFLSAEPYSTGMSPATIGAIVGGVLGGLAFIGVVVLSVIIWRRRKSRQVVAVQVAPAQQGWSEGNNARASPSLQ